MVTATLPALDPSVALPFHCHRPSRQQHQTQYQTQQQQPQQQNQHYHSTTSRPTISEPIIPVPLHYSRSKTGSRHDSLTCRSQPSQPGFVTALPGTLSHQPAPSRISYVEALIDVNAVVIETIWPSATPSTPSSVVPLRTFIQEVLKRSRTTYSTLQTALFYLLRAQSAISLHLQPKTKSQRHEGGKTETCDYGRCEQNVYINCGRRMFLASLILASKFVQDKTYRNSAWAKMANLQVAEINKAERIFSELIDYRLYIAQPIFEQWYHLFHMQVQQRATQSSTTPLSYLFLGSWSLPVQKTDYTRKRSVDTETQISPPKKSRVW
ncbi:cyclin [Phycomyces blakesleeanus NRRL 1555(-)]|uniref:Cyclin n=2 Tax=Phycomyces blakesleeanus TaxID=4837 RepID=A0A167P2N0_PHYB8|nr:cyclin [Phycomyces blakesleeanus NRRL 1555(-)]OAD77129.1 cyclin [Phycomyces blakesleeanus NRRL 1555(-)]|eukprot:XP_018295169.1 cyclin [Phycomyces blakesleeanus NRRL 1555(-)]